MFGAWHIFQIPVLVITFFWKLITGQLGEGGRFSIVSDKEMEAREAYRLAFSRAFAESNMDHDYAMRKGLEASKEVRRRH